MPAEGARSGPGGMGWRGHSRRRGAAAARVGSAGLAARMGTGMGRLCQLSSHFPGDLKDMVLRLQNGGVPLHNVGSATYLTFWSYEQQLLTMLPS